MLLLGRDRFDCPRIMIVLISSSVHKQVTIVGDWDNDGEFSQRSTFEYPFCLVSKNLVACRVKQHHLFRVSSNRLRERDVDCRLLLFARRIRDACPLAQMEV